MRKRKENTKLSLLFHLLSILSFIYFIFYLFYLLSILSSIYLYIASKLLFISLLLSLILLLLLSILRKSRLISIFRDVSDLISAFRDFSDLIDYCVYSDFNLTNFSDLFSISDFSDLGFAPTVDCLISSISLLAILIFLEIESFRKRFRLLNNSLKDRSRTDYKDLRVYIVIGS